MNNFCIFSAVICKIFLLYLALPLFSIARLLCMSLQCATKLYGYSHFTINFIYRSEMYLCSCYSSFESSKRRWGVDIVYMILWHLSAQGHFKIYISPLFRKLCQKYSFHVIWFLNNSNNYNYEDNSNHSSVHELTAILSCRCSRSHFVHLTLAFNSTKMQITDVYVSVLCKYLIC